MSGPKSSVVRARAVEALLVAPTLKSAARRAGIGKRTLQTWLTEPEFQKALAEARQAYLGHALSRLQAASGEAVTALRKGVKSTDSTVSVRAAIALIDRALKAAEHQDVKDRLAALEAHAATGSSQPFNREQYTRRFY
jgi:hypothetical protein